MKHEVRRSHIDIETAFLSGANNTFVRPPPHGQQEADVASQGTSGKADVISRLIHKGYLRVRPTLQDVAARARDYLTQELHRTIRREIRNAIAQTHQHVRLAKDDRTVSSAEHPEFTLPRNHNSNSVYSEVSVKTEVGTMAFEETDFDILKSLVLGGYFESGMRKLLTRLIRPGDCFVDIGAKLGLSTTTAARCLDGRGTVVVVEWDKRSVLILKQHCRGAGFSNLVEFIELEGPPIELSSVFQDRPKVDVVNVSMDTPHGSISRLIQACLEVNQHVAIVARFDPISINDVGIKLADWFRPFDKAGLAFRKVDSVTGLLTTSTKKEVLRQPASYLFFSRPGSNAWARLDVP